MAKGGKLTKLKSVIKSWPSLSKLNRATTPISDATTGGHDYHKISKELHPVYVGKSLRRYLVTTKIINHPLFQELVNKSGDDGAVVFASEVVLFEHLLWMLENDDTQLGSVDELVEFYTC